MDALERMLRELDESRNGPHQLLIALDAARDATGADLVIWYPGTEHADLLPAMGRFVRPAEWCRKFISALLANTSPSVDRVKWQLPLADGVGDGDEVRSAIGYRVYNTKPTWLFAISFAQGRRLDDAEFQSLRLAARILIRQNQHSQSQKRLKDSLLGLVRCLSETIDARDKYTAGHSERVSRIAVRIGKEMGLSAAESSDLHLSGLLHDIGKIGIRDEVLFKPEGLTAAEYLHMQEHAVIGDRILSQVPFFDKIRLGVRHHHERFDGTGYPDRLAGTDIPLLGRILAVADSCDAMMSTRRYRNHLSPPQMIANFRKLSGAQWDPNIVDAFLDCQDDILPIYQKGTGDSAVFAVDQLLAKLIDTSSTMYEVPELLRAAAM